MESTDGNDMDARGPDWSRAGDARRRYIVDCLETYTTPMALADLAAEVVKRESGKAYGDVTTEEVWLTYLSLYHSDIPKLVERGIVERAGNDKMVRMAGSNDPSASVENVRPGRD